MFMMLGKKVMKIFFTFGEKRKKTFANSFKLLLFDVIEHIKIGSYSLNVDEFYNTIPAFKGIHDNQKL